MEKHVEGQLEQPNTQNIYTVTESDLPLHCPLPGASLWNSPPRVYIPVQQTGRGKCIYCGAEYILDRENDG